jgi:murein DD-endopeptidase MepM/ murein hydrolase activator NlpD
LCLAYLIGSILWRNLNIPMVRKRWLDRASTNPIVLAPPFDERWYVSSGGPDPRHNHHWGSSDQEFAYDFLREEGRSFGESILAPCSGMIAHVENRQPDGAPDAKNRDGKRPFGNYVSIQVGRAYVILAHLKQGSIYVRVGETVQAGTEIGRCGNSGNSNGAHLHLHAQNQPSRNLEAVGIPVAFTDRLRSEPLLLEYNDKLG